jgi:hypothetical protein
MLVHGDEEEGRMRPQPDTPQSDTMTQEVPSLDVVMPFDASPDAPLDAVGSAPIGKTANDDGAMLIEDHQLVDAATGDALIGDANLIEKEDCRKSDALIKDGIQSAATPASKIQQQPHEQQHDEQQEEPLVASNFVVMVDDYREDFDAKIKLNSHYNGAGFPRFPFTSRTEHDDFGLMEKGGAAMDEFDAEEQMRHRLQKLNPREASEEEPESVADSKVETMTRPTFEYLRKPTRFDQMQRQKQEEQMALTTPPPLYNPEQEEAEEDLADDEGADSSLEESLKDDKRRGFLLLFIVIIMTFAISFLFWKLKKRRHAARHAAVAADYLPLRNPA